MPWEAPFFGYQSGQLPFIGRTVVPQDEAALVVGPHFEIAVPGIEPAVENLDDCEAPLAESKGARFLFAAVACMAFDADLQWASIQRTIRGQSDSCARRLTRGPTCCSDTPTSRS